MQDRPAGPAPADIQPPAASESFIPIRRTDILAALRRTPGLTPGEAERMEHVGRMLARIFHYEYHDELETLRESYYYFRPDLDDRIDLDPADRPGVYAGFLAAFETAMAKSNFVELSPAEIAEAETAQAVLGIRTRNDRDIYESIRVFTRGRRAGTSERRTWFGLRRRTIPCDVYDSVVVFMALPATTPPPRGLFPRGRRAPRLKPGTVLIKYFQDVPRPEIPMLFPGVRVVMRLEDKLMLGVPAVAGGIPILLNVIPALSVLVLVIGAYLGIVGTVEGDQVKQALAAMSALVALGGFMMRQWMSYERRTLKYQKDLTERIYFKNVNNNSGIFDYLIGAAEEQEIKESLLAYATLLAHRAPMDRDALDRAIEQRLAAEFGLQIDFEIGDALSKLERLGLLRRTDGMVTVVPPDEALAILDRAWDGFFHYGQTPPTRAGSEEREG